MPDWLWYTLFIVISLVLLALFCYIIGGVLRRSARNYPALVRVNGSTWPEQHCDYCRKKLVGQCYENHLGARYCSLECHDNALRGYREWKDKS
jgi:hypothetical protein